MPDRRTGSRSHAWAFVSAALLLAVFGLAVLAIGLRYTSDGQILLARQSQLVDLTRLGQAERDAISAQRAFLLTGSNEQRQRYWRSLGVLDQLVVALRGSGSDATEQGRQTLALQASLAKRIERATRVLEVYDQQGAAAAQALLVEPEHAAVEGALRADLDQMTESVGREVAKATAAFERSALWLLVAASLAISFGLLVLAWTYTLLRREAHSRRAAERANASSHRELQRSVEQLTAVSRDMQRLSAYASLLQTCDSVDEALDVTRVSLAALLPDTAGTVYLLGDDQRTAKPATNWGAHRLASARELSLQQCWGMRRTQPYLTDSRNSDVRCGHIASHGDAPGTATLCLPLNAHGTALGLLYLSSPEPMAGEAVAATAAEQLSLALANLKLRESLREQSVRDALTGLYNRRYLERTLSLEFAQSRGNNLPLAVLMMDIDHFKRFNDHHGHGGGDVLLAAIGQLLRKSNRSGDTACRYGGEEFTLVLPQTELAGAQTRAEAIRAAVAQLRVHHDGAPLQAVSVSIGVSAYPQCAGDIESLLASADQALYQAKAAGRDCVVCASTAGNSSPSESAPEHEPS